MRGKEFEALRKLGQRETHRVDFEAARAPKVASAVRKAGCCDPLWRFIESQPSGRDEPVCEVSKDIEITCGHESKLKFLQFGVGELAHPAGLLLKLERAQA
jgi:hypothetical protein